MCLLLSWFMVLVFELSFYLPLRFQERSLAHFFGLIMNIFLYVDIASTYITLCVAKSLDSCIFSIKYLVVVFILTFVAISVE